MPAERRARRASAAPILPPTVPWTPAITVAWPYGGAPSLVTEPTATCTSVTTSSSVTVTCVPFLIPPPGVSMQCPNVVVTILVSGIVGSATGIVSCDAANAGCTAIPTTPAGGTRVGNCFAKATARDTPPFVCRLERVGAVSATALCQA